MERLHGAFERAIAQYGYAQARYQGVFPVKCNQQRHVVEELVRKRQAAGTSVWRPEAKLNC